MGNNLHEIPQTVEAFGTISDTIAHVGAGWILDHATFVGIVLTTTGTLTGTAPAAWIVEASNDYVAAGGDKGNAPFAGTWVNVTALFTPALVAVLTGGSKQYIQAQIAARAIRVTFTATAGTGIATATYTAKDL